MYLILKYLNESDLSYLMSLSFCFGGNTQRHSLLALRGPYVALEIARRLAVCKVGVLTPVLWLHALVYL